jgi:hypothetical protein
LGHGAAVRQLANLFPAWRASLLISLSFGWGRLYNTAVVRECVCSHSIVGRCIGILWRSECLLLANVLARNFQNMRRRVQSCLEVNGGHFKRIFWCRHISHTTKVFLYKVRSNIMIIKEMPGFVASWTLCIYLYYNKL